MRIAFLSDAAYPWHLGGLEARERTEAEELAKDKGNEVHFFAMRWPDMMKEFTDKNIHYHTLISTSDKKFYRHRRRSIRTSIAFAFSTFKLFRYKFDVMEVNMFPVLHIPILLLYGKLRGCKIVLDVVEVWRKEYWYEYLGGGAFGKVFGGLAYAYVSLFLGGAGAYISNSSITTSNLVKEGVKRNMIFMLVPIIDDKVFGRIRDGAKKRKNEIVYTGRFIKEKRIDKWLKAVNAVSRLIDVKGVLIGDGPEKQSIKDEIRELGLESIVEIKPRYSNINDAYKRMAEASVLLHMSEREGFGAIALESLALGVPVVLPSYTPIPKEIRDMCIVADEKDIPRTLIKILKEKDRSKFIKNAENLGAFEISNTKEAYSRIFSHLGL
ncbi:MAG: glycosyltransferase [Candidatus Marsarchaeota archaeon]|nr:glycosyltransferase [Candidatus Marsarchaeota archaeon]